MNNFLALLFLSILAAFPGQGLATTYKVRGDLVGNISSYTVKEGDTLYDIARRHDLGIVEVMAANPGIDRWLPEKGKKLVLPTVHILPLEREGIVIDLPDLRLFYFLDPDTVMTFPVGIGKEGWQTPSGETKVVRKRKDPLWTPPASIHKETPGLPQSIPAGPDNPLGTHALNLGWPGYIIHGTNRPYGVGRRSSHGCIRLYPEDIPVLFDNVPVGAKVTIIDTSYKIGRHGRDLVLEAMPEQAQADEIIRHGEKKSRADSSDLRSILLQMEASGARINWRAVEKALESRNGLPHVIGRP